MFSFFFFFNDTATTEIYTLSLHDALPISRSASLGAPRADLRKSRRSDGRQQPASALPDLGERLLAEHSGEGTGGVPRISTIQKFLSALRLSAARIKAQRARNLRK